MAIYTVNFGTTIYGGELDISTGILTSKYNADGTEKATPDLIQLTPIQILTIIGTNNIWTDTNGEVSVGFKQGIQEYIDAQIAATQALVLNS